MKILTVILAGGTGRELSALTGHRAKTSMPFGGRYRIIDFCLSNCVHSGFSDIAVLTQYNPASLMEHIGMGKPWDLDRKRGGVFIMQPTHYGKAATWYLGTADALYQNIAILRNSDAEHILVLSGDQVYIMDYRDMLKFHVDSGRPVTLACKGVGSRQRMRFGMVRVGRDGRVAEFQEKPQSSDFSYASMGIYMFEKKYLLDILDSGKKDIVFDILIPAIAKKGVSGYRFDTYWEDIGSIPTYFKASMRLLKDRSIITRKDWPIFTKGEGLAPAKYSPSSQVSESIVAEGCIVRGKVRRSILFPGVVIENGADVEDSIIFNYSRIDRGARIRRAIVDKEAYIGKNVIFGAGRRGANLPELMKFCDTSCDPGTGDITVAGKGVRIKSGTVIPAGLVLEPESIVKV